MIEGVNGTSQDPRLLQYFETIMGFIDLRSHSIDGSALGPMELEGPVRIRASQRV